MNIAELLPLLSSVRAESSGYSARCPSHDDAHASLSIGIGADSRILIHCHAGCPTDKILEKLGLNATHLFPPSNNGVNIFATYDYRDEAGNLLFQVVRLIPKDFRQRRPDGTGEWIWETKGVRRVLYRLPELLAANSTMPVYVAEGEKDADRIRSLGLIATTNPGGAGKFHRVEHAALRQRHVLVIPDNDNPGRDHARQVMTILRGHSASVQLLGIPEQFKDVSDFLDAGHLLAELTPSDATDCSVGRPNILIDTEEHRVIRETVAALSADPNIYQRSGILVRIIRDRREADGVMRPEGSTTIQAMPAANLRERMTQIATFTKLNRNGDAMPAHPPTWLVGAVEARAEWDTIKRLIGISDAPVLRSDGSIWKTSGYDPVTGVLYEPSVTFFPMPLAEALPVLLEPVCDFPFEKNAHKAAWLAALFTPLARFAFTGPSPLFLIDANVRGAGKGLLAQVIARIVLGREMPVSSYSQDADEMRKRLTAIAIAGDRMILFDNLEGAFGGDVIDRALTSSRWKDRILGKSEEIELPLIPAWYATGNNVQVHADTLRRIIHIRLDSRMEHPEDRSEFRYDNLLVWTLENRERLLSAALTILSEFLRQGTREVDLRPYGSFEGWSAVVREAVIWAGLPDPCDTRERLTNLADTTGDTLTELLAAWRNYATYGIVVSEMLRALYSQPHPTDEPSIAMRAALENLVGCPPGKVPSVRQVAGRLKAIRRRVVDGVFLDVDSERGKHGMTWRISQNG